MQPLETTAAQSEALSRRIFVRVLVVLSIMQLLVAINGVLVSYLNWDASRIGEAIYDSTETESEPTAPIGWLHFYSIAEFAWLLFVPLVAWCVSCIRDSAFKMGIKILILVLLSSLLHSLAIQPLDHLILHWSSGVEASFAHIFDFNWFSIFISATSQLTHLAFMLGVGIAIRYWMQAENKTRQAEELQQAVLQLKHESLCRKIQPHFLFNALNTISSLVKSNPDGARDAIGRLGTLLQVSLDAEDEPEIPLCQEYDLIEDYLEIQKIRFGDRLQFDLELGDEVSNAKIPAFLLQPLVENSVKHGLAAVPNGETVSIKVDARDVDGQLLISVLDDAANGKAPSVLEESTGLKVTRQRLDAHFGGEAKIDLRCEQEAGFSVLLTLPYLDTGKDRV